jgi:hypothetical protein
MLSKVRNSYCIAFKLSATAWCPTKRPRSAAMGPAHRLHHIYLRQNGKLAAEWPSRIPIDQGVHDSSIDECHATSSHSLSSVKPARRCVLSNIWVFFPEKRAMAFAKVCLGWMDMDIEARAPLSRSWTQLWVCWRGVRFWSMG